MKMSKISLVSILLSFSFLMSSCLPDELADIEDDNPLLTDGSFISASINEEPFMAEGGSLNAIVTATITDGNLSSAITGTENLIFGSPRKTILLTLFGSDILNLPLNTEFELPFSNGEVFLSGEAAYSIATELDEEPEIVATTNDKSIHSFTITLISIDESERTMSGAFSFIASDDEADETFIVTNGEFQNVPY